MTDRISVLLGLFDGLHLGHMSAINELLRHGGCKVVYTFDSGSITTKGDRRLILTDSEKREGLIALGVDEVISVNFDLVKDMTAEEFVSEVLVCELGASTVVAGENFRFGRGGKADSSELKRLCSRLGVETSVVPTLLDSGLPVSTTRIRQLIESGKIVEANRLLGRAYWVEGEASEGRLYTDPEKVLPADGGYLTAIVYNGIQSYADVSVHDRSIELHDRFAEAHGKVRLKFLR